MKGNRFLSIVAGVIIGGVIGWWIYGFIGYFLFCGPIRSDFIPESYRTLFFWQSFYYGVIPGAVVGLFGGSVLPFTLPRGHMSKSIGSLNYLIVGFLAWFTQWDKLTYTTSGRISVSVLITVCLFLIILPVSEYLGSFIERIREP